MRGAEFRFRGIDHLISGKELCRHDGRDVGNQNLWHWSDLRGQQQNRPQFHSGNISKGNWAKKISPGCIYRLPIIKGVDIFA